MLGVVVAMLVSPAWYAVLDVVEGEE